MISKISHWIQGLWTKEKSYVITLEEALISKYLKREVHLTIIHPSSVTEPWSLLLFNDGQDFPKLSMKKTLRKFNKSQDKKLMVVGIHAQNRMQEYGTSKIVNDKGYGKLADSYEAFIILELLPYLHKFYPISAKPQNIGIAGCSLGALSAMDIAWKWNKIFGIIGAFSGSFWWRDKPYDEEFPDANRVMHRIVEESNKREQRIWLMAGTAEENSDRNANGIIDVIDDTLDLMDILKRKVVDGKQNIRYYELEGGKHDQMSWSKALPDFLHWLAEKRRTSV